MKTVKLCVVTATALGLFTSVASSQSAEPNAPPPSNTQPPNSTPPNAGSSSTLPEVQVIQQNQKKPQPPKKVAAKPKKKPAPTQPAPAAAPAAPIESTQTGGAGPNYALPESAGNVQLSPLAGSEVPIDKVPHGVSALSAADIKRDGSVIAQDTLNNRIPGVVIDDLQGNAFQTGVQYRGFEASPVNGLAQGLAVYQNGIRINEAFGDIVNWDFLPSNAINNLTVMSSNPVFGLNAIGGSISLAMKDGFTYQGADIDTRFGSFGRKQVSTEAGMKSGGVAIYGAFEAINDDGFRDFSDAQIRRGYADLGFKGESSEFHFNFTGADNHVGVTAAVPEELLAYGGRTRTFTSPQTTDNTLQMYSINGVVQATPDLSFSGVTYYRHFQQGHVDGNIADFEDCTAAPGFLCNEDDEQLFSTSGGAVADPGGAIGSIDRTSENADSFGGTLQGANKAKLFGYNNQFVLGTSYDHGHVAYGASSELGTFQPKYVVAGTGITLTGPSEITPRALTTLNDYFGVYALDTLDLTKQLSVSVGGRFNYARIEIQNDGDPTLDTLNGVNTYNRFNPSAGLTYKFTPSLSFYGGYSEANRAPTAAEIACSDPNNPCIIESALASDPPLKQVVSKTWELGFRGEQASWTGLQKVEWSLGWFRALNSDDIIQIADQSQGRGYFANAGNTQRQGIEASIAYRSERLFTYASYSYIDATFQSTNTIPSENNPANSTPCPGTSGPDAPICQTIEPGDRLPGVPRHRFKAGFDYKLTPKWIFGSDIIAASNQIFYGDEANHNTPLAGYAKVNLHTSYDITNNVQVYGLIENLFDSQYGVYGTYFNVDDAQTAAGADPSLANLTYDPNNAKTITPAIPFAAYGGVKVKY